MRRVEWLVRGTLAFCLLFGVVASQSRYDETFPFFSWDLFSKVPSPRERDYSVRILSAEGLTVPAPVYFEDADLHNAAVEIQGFHALQALGKSVDAGEAVRAAVMQRSFESTYLSTLQDVRYELVRRTYNIRQRVDCRRCFIDETVLGSHVVG